MIRSHIVVTYLGGNDVSMAGSRSSSLSDLQKVCDLLQQLFHTMTISICCLFPKSDVWLMNSLIGAVPSLRPSCGCTGINAIRQKSCMYCESVE